MKLLYIYSISKTTLPRSCIVVSRMDPTEMITVVSVDDGNRSSSHHASRHSSRQISPRPPPAIIPNKRRVAVAKGVQKTLSKTSMLVNFLPTGTLLTFEMLLPPVSGDGSCSPVSTMMIHLLLAICAASCFFFHFTDSFKAPDGTVCSE